MAHIRCDDLSEGLRDSEVVARFQDDRGRKHFLRVEREVLSEAEGQYCLPVGIVHVDPETKLTLVELPYEAETGANRLWVRPEQLVRSVEAVA